MGDANIARGSSDLHAKDANAGLPEIRGGGLRAGADGLLMTGCLCSAAKWKLTRSEPDTIAT